MFLRFDLENFGLERTGTLIAFIPPIFVKNAWCGAKLRPKKQKSSRLLSSRVLKFERSRGDLFVLFRMFPFFAHIEIVVAFLVVNFFVFLVITRDHGGFEGRH